jgi:hypothetical protein
MSVRTIFKFVPNLLKRAKKASFILHHPDDDDLNDFRKETPGTVSSTLIVRSKRPRKMKDDESFISAQDWEEDEQELMEKTRGAFVVYNDIDDTESEFVSRMENYRKYYPVIFISPEDADEEFYSSHLSGWKEYTSKTGLIIFVNKGRKEFENYTVNFKKILSEGLDEVKPMVSTRIAKDDKGSEFVEEIFDTGLKSGSKKKGKTSRRTPSPITTKKPSGEEDWSIFEGLPRPSMEPDPTDPTWTKEFYLYLRDLVSRITPPGKEKLIDIIVNKNTIRDVWFNVFTSIYANPNKGENYESYEAVGDSVVKYVFYVYLYERFGSRLDQAQLNDLKTKFLSKGWQSIAGEKMGLTDWVLILKELKNHPATKEDMQESFCGAIEIILNKASPNRGYATTMLLYMFHRLFKDYHFDLSKKLTPKETQVEQWFPQVATGKREEKVVIKKPQSIDRDDWKQIVRDFGGVMKKHGVLMPISDKAGKNETGVRYEEDVKKDGSATFRVYLNDAGYKVLEEKGFKVNTLKNKLLSEAKSGTLGQAETTARIRAMEKLESLGLTQDWKERQRIEKNTRDVQRIDEALIKAKQEFRDQGKVVKVYPAKVKETKSFKVFQLYAVMKDDRKINLETSVIFTGGGANPTNVFQELVDRYLSSDSSDGSDEDSD